MLSVRTFLQNVFFFLNFSRSKTIYFFKKNVMFSLNYFSGFIVMKLQKYFKQHPFPWAALSSALLIILSEMFFYWAPDALRDYPDFSNLWIKWKWEHTQHANNYQTLFLGECFGMTAFKPEIYDQYSHYQPSFNLCVYQRNTFLAQYLLLKSYLKSATEKPKIVFLECMEITLYDQTPFDENVFNQHLLPFFGPEEAVYTEIARWNPQYRPLFFPCWKTPMKGFFKRLWNWSDQQEQYRKRQEEFIQQKGYYPLGQEKKPNLEKMTKLPDSVRKKMFSFYNTFYIEQILHFLAQQEIPVILLVPPLRADRRKLWNKEQIGPHYIQYFIQLQKKYPNVIALAANEFINFFDQMDHFQDANHLHDRSAEQFTRTLAEYSNRFSLR